MPKRQRQMQPPDHPAHLVDGDVAREILALVLRQAFEGQDFGMVARRDEAPRRGVAGVVERHRLSVPAAPVGRSEEHTSELQSLMRIPYAVLRLKNKTTDKTTT